MSLSVYPRDTVLGPKRFLSSSDEFRASTDLAHSYEPPPFSFGRHDFEIGIAGELPGDQDQVGYTVSGVRTRAGTRSTTVVGFSGPGSRTEISSGITDKPPSRIETRP
jgi:hypothetical protein